MITKDAFRNSMSRFATGVTVVTTVDNHGELHGMTANAFSSVCLEPPTVLVCVDHRTNTYRFVEAGRRFGVNILRDEQEAIGAYFARRPEDRHGDISYTYKESASGLPALDDTLAFFGCRVVDSHVYGDHTIYIAQVEDICQGKSGEPLLFYESRFANLGRKK